MKPDWRKHPSRAVLAFVFLENLGTQGNSRSRAGFSMLSSLTLIPPLYSVIQSSHLLMVWVQVFDFSQRLTQMESVLLAGKFSHLLFTEVVVLPDFRLKGSSKLCRELNSASRLHIDPKSHLLSLCGIIRWAPTLRASIPAENPWGLGAICSGFSTWLWFLLLFLAPRHFLCFLSG